MKKLLSGFLMMFILFSCTKRTTGNNNEITPSDLSASEPKIANCISFNKNIAVKDTGKKEFHNTNAIELAKDMKCGWNLGNTLDATNGKGLETETSWGMPLTTKQMIDGLAKSKIKTIRIPVSWSRHIIDDKYTIDPQWMKRVKQIVDWAISNDMYVILNCHHDNKSALEPVQYGEGYCPSSVSFEESMKFLQNIWAQIAFAFNDGYDEHLIFELLNEPRLKDTKWEWYFDPWDKDCKDANNCLTKFNQALVYLIRKSGGNNQKRKILITGLAASLNSIIADQFVIPKDDEPGKIMISVHMYSPYSFAMENPGKTEFTETMQQELTVSFNRLEKKFISKGYPVIIGEYGATNKNNLKQRVNWFKFFVSAAKEKGIPCCLWDNGIYRVTNNDFSERYGFYSRKTQKWYFPEILDAIIESVY
ncbi:MAG: glycoside hydrolase family 5 protein [Treponema sp.]|nr:glycoside hydrolase family 5 protein [Treponema sp.]